MKIFIIKRYIFEKYNFIYISEIFIKYNYKAKINNFHDFLYFYLYDIYTNQQNSYSLR